MAAEAEHVRPGGEAEVFELGELAEAEAFGDEPAGVVGDGQRGELVGGGDAAVEGAGAFGGLGGVLGDVAGDGGVGELAAGGDGPDVELRPQASRRAGGWRRPGWSTRTCRRRVVMAAVSRSVVAQAGGSVAGPSGPSRRMMAWKWTTPRRWYSATLAKEIRTCWRGALWVSPAWRARARRRAMVKRRQSSGAQALNRTAPV